MNQQGPEQFVRHDIQAHIYSGALRNNVKQLRSLCAPDVKFCAVVKSNAYGHGIKEVVGLLRDVGVDFLAVANVFEALHIAPLIGRQSILILQPMYPGLGDEHVIASAEKGFHWSIASLEAVEYASSVLAGRNDKLNVHINVETGMGRCGIEPEFVPRLIERIDASPNLNLTGLYTHFATADEDDLSFAYEQLKLFNDFLTRTGLASRKDLLIHAANSAATIKIPDSHFDMVRCGIAVYGYFSRRQKKPEINLTPVMKMQAPIIRLKKVPKGNSVSYGRCFVARRDTVVAVVPVGYGDGYGRIFSNIAKVKIDQAVVPVIGRICMDQLMLDVTDVNRVAVGQMVTIIEDSHDSPCSVYSLADLADTICYEVLTNIGPHISRIIR
jgi:alanine racemase